MNTSIDPLLMFLSDSTGKRNSKKIAGRRVINPVLTSAEAEAREKSSGQEAAIVRFFNNVLTGEDRRDEFENCLCTRKGESRLDYDKVTEYFQEKHGILLAKGQVKCAVSNLRASMKKHIDEMTKKQVGVANRIQDVLSLLNGLHGDLVQLDPLGQTQRDHAAISILNLVRAVVSHILPADFAENVQDADLDEIEGMILNFARSLPANDKEQASDFQLLRKDVARLLQVLQDYDVESHSDDLEIVEIGTRVIIDLVGQDHLCGLFAQLNIIVTIRELITASDYASEMSRLATKATELHKDEQTARLRRRISKLPEEDRLPSPIRLASYCRGNFIFRSLAGCLVGEMNNLEEVQVAIETVKSLDSGFEEIASWEIAYAAVAETLSFDSVKIKAVRVKYGNRLNDIIDSMRRHIDYQAVLDVTEKLLRVKA